MLALIDGDAITFIAASSADGRVYVCDDGSEHKYKKDALLVCTNPTLEYRPEPDSHAMHNAKLLMKDALETAGTDECVVYLKGDGNFREEIFAEYKHNRNDQRRPHHIQTVRDWLVRHYDTKFCDGVEVDDILGIVQSSLPEDTIIVSHDKDLDMIPGWHVRLKRGGAHEKYYITPEEGMHKFWCQVLTGDATDNIAGIRGVGPKTAEKILFGMMGADYDDYEDLVLNEYTARGYSHADFERARDLIWILREPLAEPNGDGDNGGESE